MATQIWVNMGSVTSVSGVTWMYFIVVPKHRICCGYKLPCLNMVSLDVCITPKVRNIWTTYGLVGGIFSVLYLAMLKEQTDVETVGQTAT